jgi:hypothetical protein
LEQWAASDRRAATCDRLMNLFASQGAGGVDVSEAAALLVEFAATLQADWVQARVRLVRDRLEQLGADHVPDALLKKILLNLLLRANAREEAQVTEILREALGGDPGEVERFRLGLLNWLVDKVVDGSPPLPDELLPARPASVDAPQSDGSIAAHEEWLPASKAVERAEQSGQRITLTWLTRDARKHGVRIRPRTLPGSHKQEVEWSSLAGVLLKHARPARESDDEVASRLRAAQEEKRRQYPLD